MLNARNLPSSGGNQYEPIEVGTYPARLVQVITLGIQPQRPFKGEEKPPALDLMTTYELLDEFLPDEDGNLDETKPRWLNERFAFYPLSNTRANSTKRYYSLDPNEDYKGDWGELLGTPCMVNVIQYTSSRDNSIKNAISGVSSMRAKEAAKAPSLINPAVAFDFYEPNEDDLKLLAPWVIEIFTQAVDYKGSELEEMVERLKKEKAAGSVKEISKVKKVITQKKSMPKPVLDDIDEDDEDDEEDKWG